MFLAAILVRHFRGAGIALALSVSSVVNTALLLAFLKKNPNIAVRRALGSALLYTLKLVALSALAVIPVYLLSPRLLKLFAGRGRFISYGAPLAINALGFALLGILLLLVTRDRQLGVLISMIRRKKDNADEATNA
jgi:putative peptidoglycan lipid II flippase